MISLLSEFQKIIVFNSIITKYYCFILRKLDGLSLESFLTNIKYFNISDINQFSLLYMSHLISGIHQPQKFICFNIFSCPYKRVIIKGMCGSTL